MVLVGLGKSFDGNDFAAPYPESGNKACWDYFAVKYDRTRAALAGKAARLRAKKAEIPAQNVNKPHAGFAVDKHVFAVKDKVNSHSSLVLRNIFIIRWLH
jgi:hypothetical protein